MSDLVAREPGLAGRWRSAWLAATPEAFGDCCHVDVRYQDPLEPEPLEGLGALAAHARRVLTAFPDLRVEDAGPAIVQGDHACLPWRFAGTHKGDSGTLPASNRYVTIHGVHFLELRGGDVHRARGFFDLYDVAVQLALLPKRGSLGETALMALRGFGLVRPRA
jgi:predicted ester cyclase